MTHSERRQIRSEKATRALSLFLASHARKSGARAAAIADTDGLLIAGSGQDDLEILAAEGSARVAGLKRGGGVFGDSIVVHGHTLVLSTLGAPSCDRHEAERAASRILPLEG